MRSWCKITPVPGISILEKASEHCFLFLFLLPHVTFLSYPEAEVREEAASPEVPPSSPSSPEADLHSQQRGRAQQPRPHLRPALGP